MSRGREDREIFGPMTKAEKAKMKEEMKEILDTVRRGIYPKYCVTKAQGETDPNAVYFVLRLDKGDWQAKASRAALLEYARVARLNNPTLAKDCVYMVFESEERNREGK